MTHPNIEFIQQGYEAFGNGDLDTIRQVFDADIEFNILGRNDLARTYRGVDDVFGFFGELIQRTDGTFKLEPHAWLADEDGHVVVLLHVTAQAGERSVDQNTVHVWHVRDGRAVAFWDHWADQYAADEALGR